MRLNWRQRLEIDPCLKDINSWPYIDHYTLRVSKRKAFNRNRKIIMRVLSGKSHKETAKLANVHPTYINYLLNRCLGGDEDFPPALSEGLISSRRIRKSVRHKRLSENCDSGAKGSFQKILIDHPNIKERLDNLLINFLKRSRTAENITPGRLHREFKRSLEELNWPRNKYPFDTDSSAYETCRKYYHDRLKELRLPKPSKRKQRIILPKAKYAYEEVQIDAWLADIGTSLDVVYDDRLVPIRISRFTVYVASDVATGCRLSYHIALTAHPTKEDLLSVIENIHLPWKAMKLTTKGIQYLPGAGFPSSLAPIYQHAGIGVIKLDNALAHHANAVRDYVCNKMGSTLNLGIPGEPKARGHVEYVFKQLAELSLRFASTTGNNPIHSLKETTKNKKSPPLLKLHEFEEMLDVTLASYNATERQFAGGGSPLNLMKHQMESGFLTLNYDGADALRSPFIRSEIRKIIFLDKEQRAPFIRFQGFRYNGQCLRIQELLKEKVRIDYDPRDIRAIKAFKLSGELIGELRAPMTQQHFPLSIQTLKIMKKRAKGSTGKVMGTLDEYFIELSNSTDSPKSNLELVRLAREIFPRDEKVFKIEKNKKKNPTPQIKPIQNNNVRTIPNWRAKIASTR